MFHLGEGNYSFEFALEKEVGEGESEIDDVGLSEPNFPSHSSPQFEDVECPSPESEHEETVDSLVVGHREEC